MQIHSQYADFKFVGTPVNEEYITITVNRKLTVIKHSALLHAPQLPSHFMYCILLP